MRPSIAQSPARKHAGPDDRHIQLFLAMALPDNVFGIDLGLTVEISAARGGGGKVLANGHVVWGASVHADGADMDQAATTCGGHGVANGLDRADGVGDKVRPRGPIRNCCGRMEYHACVFERVRVQTGRELRSQVSNATPRCSSGWRLDSARTMAVIDQPHRRSSRTR